MNGLHLCYREKIEVVSFEKAQLLFLIYPFFLLYIQANGIIKKLQGEVRTLVGKIKVKNTVTVSQEKILQETSEKLQSVEKDLQSAQQQLNTKEEQVCHRLKPFLLVKQ